MNHPGPEPEPSPTNDVNFNPNLNNLDRPRFSSNFPLPTPRQPSHALPEYSSWSFGRLPRSSDPDLHFETPPRAPHWATVLEDAQLTLPPPVMPPTRRNEPLDGSTHRPPRMSDSEYVDLTPFPDNAPPRRRRSNDTPEAGPSAKRQRWADGSYRERPDFDAENVESVDLTEELPSVQEVLQKQRREAVKAQTKPDEPPTTFKNFTCVICMDTPTDLTATACGHLFCHTCLMEALIAGENRAGPGEPRRSQCPVCRKNINRTKPGDIIPLALMKKGLATQPRKKASPSVASTITVE